MLKTTRVAIECMGYQELLRNYDSTTGPVRELVEECLQKKEAELGDRAYHLRERVKCGWPGPKVETIRGFRITEHARQRMEERGVDPKVIKRLFDNSTHKLQPHGEYWVLDNGYYRIVVSLQNSCIVTAYIHGKEAK